MVLRSAGREERGGFGTGREWWQINVIHMIVFAVHKIFCTNSALGERHCYFNFELVLLAVTEIK